jgi:hypothetical protein
VPSSQLSCSCLRVELSSLVVAGCTPALVGGYLRAVWWQRQDARVAPETVTFLAYSEDWLGCGAWAYYCEGVGRGDVVVDGGFMFIGLGRLNHMCEPGRIALRMPHSFSRTVIAKQWLAASVPLCPIIHGCVRYSVAGRNIGGSMGCIASSDFGFGTSCGSACLLECARGS